MLRSRAQNHLSELDHLVIKVKCGFLIPIIMKCTFPLEHADLVLYVVFLRSIGFIWVANCYS